jgi:hypothetical protein
MRLEVFMAVIKKITVFWNVMPCNLMMVAVRFSKTLANICQTTLHHIPEDESALFLIKLL